MVFYHYEEGKNTLIGTKFFLAEENRQLKIQLPARVRKTIPIKAAP